MGRKDEPGGELDEKRFGRTEHRAGERRGAVRSLLCRSRGSLVLSGFRAAAVRFGGRLHGAFVRGEGGLSGRHQTRLRDCRRALSRLSGSRPGVAARECEAGPGRCRNAADVFGRPEPGESRENHASGARFPAGCGRRAGRSVAASAAAGRDGGKEQTGLRSFLRHRTGPVRVWRIDRGKSALPGCGLDRRDRFRGSLAGERRQAADAAEAAAAIIRWRSSRTAGNSANR